MHSKVLMSPSPVILSRLSSHRFRPARRCQIHPFQGDVLTCNRVSPYDPTLDQARAETGVSSSLLVTMPYSHLIPAHRSLGDVQPDCLFEGLCLFLRARYGRCDNRRDDQKSAAATGPFPGHLEASRRHGFFYKPSETDQNGFTSSAVKLRNAFQNFNLRQITPSPVFWFF